MRPPWPRRRSPSPTPTGRPPRSRAAADRGPPRRWLELRPNSTGWSSSCRKEARTPEAVAERLAAVGGRRDELRRSLEVARAAARDADTVEAGAASEGKSRDGGVERLRGQGRPATCGARRGAGGAGLRGPRRLGARRSGRPRRWRPLDRRLREMGEALAAARGGGGEAERAAAGLEAPDLEGAVRPRSERARTRLAAVGDARSRAAARIDQLAAAWRDLLALDAERRTAEARAPDRRSPGQRRRRPERAAGCRSSASVLGGSAGGCRRPGQPSAGADEPAAATPCTGPVGSPTGGGRLAWTWKSGMPITDRARSVKDAVGRRGLPSRRSALRSVWSTWSRPMPAASRSRRYSSTKGSAASIPPRRWDAAIQGAGRPALLAGRLVGVISHGSASSRSGCRPAWKSLPAGRAGRLVFRVAPGDGA